MISDKKKADGYITDNFITCITDGGFENFEHCCNAIEEVFETMIAFKHIAESKQVVLSVIPKACIERIDFIGAKTDAKHLHAMKYESEGKHE